MQKHYSKKELREFGIIIGIFFPFLIGWLIPLVFSHDLKVWTFWIGIPALILGLFKPKFLYYPFKFWIKLGNILSFVNTYLILGLVYIMVLIPTSIIMRFFGYDPLKSLNPKRISYREDKNSKTINLERVF